MGGIVGKPRDCWSYCHDRTLLDIPLIIKHITHPSHHIHDKSHIYESITKIHGDLQDKYKSILKRIWKQYDLNSDGLLSRSELQDLVRDSLICMKKTYLQQLVIHVCQEMMKLTKQHIQQQAQKAGRTLTTDELSGIDHRFEQDQKLAITIGDAQMDLLIQNSIALSDQLWLAMDAPQDGRVTQTKFLQHYMKASNQIVMNHLGSLAPVPNPTTPVT